MARPAGSTTKATGAKTTTSHVASIAKQQFDILNAAKKAAEQLEILPTLVDGIKAQVKEIEENFAYQLQEKEIEHDDKKKEKDAQLDAYVASIEEKKVTLNAELEEKRKEQQREIEQLEYDHKVAIREKRYDLATKIAAEQSKVVVDAILYKELQSVKRANDEDLANVAQTTELQVTERLTSKHNTEIKDLVSKSELSVAMLRKDIESANKQIAQLVADKAVLEDRIAGQTATMAKMVENVTRPSTTIVEGKKS